jgi:enterochelin esterase family protein
MRLPEILDSLIDVGAVPPTIALMIDDGAGTARLADLANHAQFLRLVVERLLPWLHAGWRVTADARRTIVTGSSAGGLAAAYVAFKHPDIFGNVLSQSGAFWRGNEGSGGAPYEWLIDQYATSSRRSVRFFLEVGTTESGGALGGAAPSILEANRRMRDVLTVKGYRVLYGEVPQGRHDAETWRVRLPYGLAALGGPVIPR